ncbi:hypothetical protein [Streptomyces sp. NBC_00989]|uniref:hypothetical protein n=1 Tax=Streptomyces sp. NBC_00989 TaxID=2903705 RepID=UPI003863A8AE|nr:hypothetical protein OG714_00445 [Streptomyces sp. NBC_00989]WSW98087.1 hypothetical protein OG714_53695 [Streptomyces sp. NBC_00989]
MTTTALTDAVERDALVLLAAYEGGNWFPADGEHALAGDLARVRWNGSAFRAALRDLPASVRAGHLVAVLDPAATVLEAVDASGARNIVQALRQLLDALAVD